MRLRTWLWVLVFLVLPAAAIAQDNKEVLIQDLYIKSGLENQIVQMPMIIQFSFDQAVARDHRLKGIPRNVIGEIRASIKTAFAPNNMKKTILSACREKLSFDDLKNAIEWLDSPTGRKFTQLEEAASTPERYAEIQQFAIKLQESPPLPEQLKIIRQLDDTVRATETSVEVAMNAQYAVALATVASLPKEQRPTQDNLIAAIEKTRPQIERAMRSQTLVSLLYTYRDVAHEEIDRYIAFASSPTGKNYHDAVIFGLKKALLDGSYKWGELIADILKHSTGKTEA